MRTPCTPHFTLQSGGIRLYPLPTAWNGLAVATALVDEMAGSGGRVGGGAGAGIGRGRKEQAYMQVGVVVLYIDNADCGVKCVGISVA